jgi:hypothetical protein
MRDDFDVEDSLRRYRAEPSARVKQFVVTRFNEMRDPGTTLRRAPSFWKRPVPLYLAATALLILVGLSFAAGRSTSWGGDETGSSRRSAGEKNPATSPDIEWVAAENDLL